MKMHKKRSHNTATQPHKKATQAQRKLRVISGEYRTRQLQFSDIPGLRPTTDAIRETLFNWLAGDGSIEGARCLDAFAGSGALGIEALSRGAREVIFIEQSPQAVRDLEQNLANLKISKAQVLHTDSRQWFAHAASAFDLIFLDPPFGHNLIVESCYLIEQHRLLALNGKIYLEMEADQAWQLPDNWQMIKEKKIGQVRFGLFKQTRIEI